MPRGKGKKEYKVSGNRNPLQRGSGASQRKCEYGKWRPNDAEKLYRNKGWQLGRIQKSGERGNWTFGQCAGDSEEEH